MTHPHISSLVVSDGRLRPAMKPITFRCEETLPHPPEVIAERMLDLSNWLDFRGYGPIPPIASAEFETRPPGVVGTRIRVQNKDGSTHVEEIAEWRPTERLELHMKEFSAPLSRLSGQFEEIWDFSPRGPGETHVVRSFRLHPASPASWGVLWIISFFLKRAIARHLRQMKT